MTVKVAEDGSFSTPFELTAGRWAITVTASSPQGKTAAQTRNVTVVYKGVNLVVTIDGGRAWIKVWVDGKLDPELGAAGSVIANGKTLTFTGKESIEVRSGSSGVTHFTLNGTPLGALGRPGVPETWLFAPPDPPVKTAAPVGRGGRPARVDLARASARARCLRAAALRASRRWNPAPVASSATSSRRARARAPTTSAGS